MTGSVDEILSTIVAKGGDAYFGENLSQLEHALQAAALAERAGSTPAVVVAALLHDIGHMLHGLPETIADEGIDGRHQETGAAWLSRRFGTEITEPVRLHVAAKRYLCHREPEYLEALSPASKASLELQGGPFSESEVAAFERNRYFREAVALRRWDDEAKITGLDVPGLEHYRGMIAKCLTPPRRAFTFIDLFAGIGGFRLGLEKLGGECVFSSEWDRYSRQTYEAWFGEVPFGDIREITPADVPDHDILAGGFPCQPFSLAGVSKKNSLGRAHGFLCDTQGTLFFEVAKIIAAKRPAAVFLENVKNLQSHDRGRTWQVIEGTLAELGYWVFSGVVDAAGWVPQHRERVYIVCFDQARFPLLPDFRFPVAPGERRFAEILEPDPDPKYTLSQKLWQYLQDYAAKHRAKGNGFGFGIANPDGVARTLSARYHKDGSEILIAQSDGRRPRRLTPRECARLMGFEQWCEEKIVVSDTQAYRQFGNAVVPKVIEAVGREILSVL